MGCHRGDPVESVGRRTLTDHPRNAILSQLTSQHHQQRRRHMKTASDMIQAKGDEIVRVPEGTTVLDALKRMNQRNVGAILITRDDKPVGIWTERDLLRNILDPAFDPRTLRIEDVMTKDLIFAPHTDTVYNLMDKFLGLRVRHLIIEKEGRTIGVVSGGDVMKASIQEKDAELKQLNSMVGWDYYENWCWRPESK
jgi:signal-transduction protein with cAMP-binding, CBS, and nucleotidyltransferase domain